MENDQAGEAAERGRELTVAELAVIRRERDGARAASDAALIAHLQGRVYALALEVARLTETPPEPDIP